ncbi:MAG TPA: universal stress protein [Chryseosolibacter sp.]
MKTNDGILCLIDFSDSSKETLEWAVSLAQQMKKRLTILYTYRLVNSRDRDLLEMRKQIEETARQQFVSLEQDVLKNSGVKYDFVIEIGFAIHRVREYAKKNGLSVLVMGKKVEQVKTEPIEEFAESVHVPLFLVP